MTSFVLKCIALLTMTIDHAGAMLGAMGIQKAFTIGIPNMFALDVDVNLMRTIGRMAFPIYAFLIAEGCRRTRNQGKYILRLLVFALISELPFNMLVSASPLGVELFYRGAQNVFFTLALGAAACALHDRLRPQSEGLGILAALGVAMLAHYLHTDYGMYGVATIFAAYLCRNTKESAVAVTGIMGGLMYLSWYGAPYLALAVLAAGVLMFFYNGKPGPRAAWMKWAFYAYYPAHILVIVACGMWG